MIAHVFVLAFVLAVASAPLVAIWCCGQWLSGGRAQVTAHESRENHLQVFC